MGVEEATASIQHNYKIIMQFHHVTNGYPQHWDISKNWS